MVDYYKTNEETLSVSVKEFVDEWYNKQEYMLVDIRELDRYGSYIYEFFDALSRRF